MERKRWVDIAKALGIFCVVTYHALPAGTLLYRYFATFHLPLFAFLSGYVFNSRSVRTKNGLMCYCKKKIKSIYVPFVSYSLVFMILHNLFCSLHFIGEVNGNFPYTGFGDYVNKTVQILTLGGGGKKSLTGPLWYLIPLLELTVVFSVISHYVGRSQRNGDLFIAVVCSAAFVLFSNLDLPRHFSDAMRLMLFYCMGYLSHERGLVEAFQRNKEYLLIAVPAAVIAQIICLKYIDSWLSQNLAIVVCAAVSGIFLMVDLSLLINQYLPRAIVSCFEYVGRNTMCILVWHFLAFSIVRWLYTVIYQLPLSEVEQTAIIPDLRWTGIYVVVGIMVPLGFQKITKRIRTKVFSKIDKNKLTSM